jgi:hypothetical protein
MEAVVSQTLTTVAIGGTTLWWLYSWMSIRCLTILVLMGERRGECSDDGNTDDVSHAQGSFDGLILLVSSRKISLSDYSSQNLDVGVIEITDWWKISHKQLQRYQTTSDFFATGRKIWFQAAYLKSQGVRRWNNGKNKKLVVALLSVPLRTLDWIHWYGDGKLGTADWWLGSGTYRFLPAGWLWLGDPALASFYWNSIENSGRQL